VIRTDASRIDKPNSICNVCHARCAGPRVKYRRTPFLVVTQEEAVRKDVYGSVGDHIARQAQLLRGEQDSDTVIICMHPIGSPAYCRCSPSSPVPAARHRLDQPLQTVGDAALQMENVLLDIAACVRDARERLGYRKVVLAGWSGGGSPMMGYQAEAEKPTITRTAPTSRRCSPKPTCRPPTRSLLLGRAA